MGGVPPGGVWVGVCVLGCLWWPRGAVGMWAPVATIGVNRAVACACLTRYCCRSPHGLGPHVGPGWELNVRQSIEAAGIDRPTHAERAEYHRAACKLARRYGDPLPARWTGAARPTRAAELRKPRARIARGRKPKAHLVSAARPVVVRYVVTVSRPRPVWTTVTVHRSRGLLEPVRHGSYQAAVLHAVAVAGAREGSGNRTAREVRVCRDGAPITVVRSDRRISRRLAAQRIAARRVLPGAASLSLRLAWAVSESRRADEVRP